MRELTKKQSLIYTLDQEGLTLSEISQRLGYSKSDICNVKKVLAAKGKSVSVHWSLLRRAAAAEQPASKEVDKSPLEPEDDEMPDADEPVLDAAARCHCGLLLPCYHAPVSPWQNPGDESRYDDVDEVEQASVENHHRRPKRVHGNV